ncbi:hypothetical protein DPMN_039299 [Dreissena polymorpha]|uniref:Uncharacterized protein n=1 Tax=Dreissena polymorpha TaxID=45954 RepID=A0A9D4MH48_DREPO|nr:hypothetical protein DPMN_039299 [Dreissena polymorpha]
MMESFDKKMVLFSFALYVCEVGVSSYATHTENTLTFLPLKGYHDLLECDAKSCTLRSQDNYVVSKTDNGGILLNLSDETYGNYTCFQISQRENAKYIYVGYTDETHSNAVQFTKVLERKDVLECEFNNSIPFKFKNASSGKEDVIAKFVHTSFCYESSTINIRLVIRNLIRNVTKETEGIYTCFETNNKTNEVQTCVRMSAETEPTRPTSTLATDVSTKTSDDALNTGFIIVLVYTGVITVLLIFLATYRTCWEPCCPTNKVMYGLLFLWIFVNAERTEGCKIFIKKKDILEYEFNEKTLLSFTSLTSMKTIFFEWCFGPYNPCTISNPSLNETFRLVTIGKGAMLIIKKLSQDTFGTYACSSKNSKGNSILIHIVNDTVTYEKIDNLTQNSDNTRQQLSPPRGTDSFGLMVTFDKNRLLLSTTILSGLAMFYGVALLFVCVNCARRLYLCYTRAGNALDLVSNERCNGPIEESHIQLVNTQRTETVTVNISPEKKISAEEEFCTKLLQLAQHTTLNGSNTFEVEIE